MTVLPIPTDQGAFYAAYSSAGLQSLSFPRSRRSRSPRSVAATPEVRRWHALTTRAVARALRGLAPDRLPPLDLAQGTVFQRRVWGVLRKIAAGRVRSYADVARAVGRPGAARAVGTACGANPIPLLVPCHRVIAADGGLGGFSAGVRWKQQLLAVERVRTD